MKTAPESKSNKKSPKKQDKKKKTDKKNLIPGLCETIAHYFPDLSDRTGEMEYPRLPIRIIADGPYPNRTFSDICKKDIRERNVTSEDGNPPSVREEVLCPEDITGNNTRQSVVHTQGKTLLRNHTRIGDPDCRGFFVGLVRMRRTNRR